MPNGPSSLWDQITNGMGFHPGNVEVEPLYERLRQEFIKLALLVDEIVPPGRDKSLAVTSLEDALMRSIRGIAINLTPLGAERGAEVSSTKES